MSIYKRNNFFISPIDTINCDNYLRTLWTMAHSVFNQIMQNPFQLYIINLNLWQLWLKNYTHRVPCQESLCTRESAMHNFGNVTPFLFEHKCAHINTRHFN